MPHRKDKSFAQGKQKEPNVRALPAKKGLKARKPSGYQRAKPGTQFIFIRDISSALKQEFKAACGYKRTSMTQEILRLMMLTIEEVDGMREEVRKKMKEELAKEARDKEERAAKVADYHRRKRTPKHDLPKYGLRGRPVRRKKDKS